MEIIPASLENTMLTGQNILFMSLPKHDGYYTSTPWQLATEMSYGNHVIFVDHPYTFIDFAKGFFKSNIKKRIKAYWKNCWFEKDGVTVILMPFVWPVNILPKGKIYNFFSNINHQIIAGRINRYLKSHQIDALIYVNSFNFYFPQLYKHLKTTIRLNVYHCIDPMVKKITIKHGSYLQQMAASKADLVISTAPSLQKQFIERGITKSYLVPNAANFELFNKVVHEPTISSKEKTIAGKVFGYLGNIERRIDYGLLLAVMQMLPDWHLVLAGPTEKRYIPEGFLDHERIHCIGPVPHEEAPLVVKRFDVAVIPFQCDEVSSGIYPLKLYEYMATGKPVVSTNFNPDILSTLQSVVSIASDASQFANAILLAYATDSSDKRNKRIRIASQNTWKKRAQLFGAYLAQELQQKQDHQPYVAQREN